MYMEIKNNIEYFGLIEKNTYVIGGITTSLSAANFIIEKSLGSFFLIPHFHTKQGFKSISESYWEFCFNPDDRSIFKHDFRPELIAAEYYSSVKAKLIALEAIARNSQIQKNRYRGNNNDFTDLILIKREEQAKQILRGDLSDICYIEQYALANDLSLESAAQDIVVRSSLMHSDLAKIEGMKYQYFNSIFNCIDSKQLPNIVNQFLKECWFSN